MAASYDVFISYAWSQRDWVEEFAGHLRAMIGHDRVFRDVDDLLPGQQLSAAVEKALGQSRHVILVVTPESMASPWVTREISAKVTQAMKGKGSVIPLILVPAPMGAFGADTRSIDVSDGTSTSYRSAIESIVKVVGKRALSDLNKAKIAQLDAPPLPVRFEEWRLIEEIRRAVGRVVVPSRKSRRKIVEKLDLSDVHGILESFATTDEAYGNALIVHTAKVHGIDPHAAARRVVSDVRLEFFEDGDELYQSLGELIDRIDAAARKAEERREASRIAAERGSSVNGSANATPNAVPADSRELDLATLRRLYLEQVESDHREIAPLLRDKSPISFLEDIYVEIEIAPPTGSGKLGGFYGDESAKTLAGRRLDLKKLIELQQGGFVTRRWVIRGQPGSGKTTVMRRLAHQLAADRLKGHPGYFPVFLQIRDVVESKSSIPELIAERLRLANGSASIPASLITTLLENVENEGSLVYFLDSLDEVPKDLRPLAARRLRDEAQSHPKAGYVVTSRIVDYTSPSSDFREVDLCGLERPQQEKLLGKWLVDDQKKPDHERIAATLDGLQKSPRMAEMAASPLLLTLIAVVAREGEFTATRRSELFDQIFDALMNRAHNADGRDETIDSRPLVRRALAEIAYLFTEKDILGKRCDDIARLFTKEIRLREVAEELKSASIWKGDYARMLKDVAHFTGILGPHDSSGASGQNRCDWKFWHRGFQEALTAESLGFEIEEKRIDIAAVTTRLLAAEGDLDRWAEPLALLCGHIPGADAAVIDLFRRDKNLGLRVLGTAEGLSPDSVREILRLETDDLEERRRIILEIPSTVGGDAAVRLLERVARESKVREDLWFVDEALLALIKATENSAPDVQRMAATARRRLFDRLPRPKKEWFGKIPTFAGPKNYWALIPAGTFMMGSATTEVDRHDNEGPQHRVTLSRPFFLGIVPITVGIYRKFDPDFEVGSDENEPVTRVSWYAANAFGRWLGQVYPGATLPTEAQWEYACRGGTTTRFWSGDDDRDLDRVGWFSGNSGGRRHPVAGKPANPFGLFDMHGNVWEWCSDFWGPYPSEESVDSNGSATGELRVMRGGSAWSDARRARSACRSGGGPANRSVSLGFRVAFPAPDDR